MQHNLIGVHSGSDQSPVGRSIKNLKTHELIPYVIPLSIILILTFIPLQTGIFFLIYKIFVWSLCSCSVAQSYLTL